LKRSWQPSGILVFVILVITPTAFAQPPSLQFQHLTDAQGLSNNRAWAITQDKYGFIWIGSQDGLNRFDGYKVDVYRAERGNKNSLPNNYVRCLFTDSRGVVWIGTANGLAYYDYHSNSFQSFFRGKGENTPPGNSISVIKEDVYGKIWVGTNTGLCSFDIKTKRFQRFLHDDHSNSISSNHIRDIDFAPDGAMWITTGNGLNRLDLSMMRFTSFFHDPKDSTTISGNILTQIAMDKRGIFGLQSMKQFSWSVSTPKPIARGITEPSLKKRSHIPNNTPRDIFIDRKGRLWGRNRPGRLVSLFTWQRYFLPIPGGSSRPKQTEVKFCYSGVPG
jgi:ligand-binding sensor domain-containing protein